MVELGNLAGARGAEWIGRPPHEELQRKVRPLLPCDDPFYQPPSGYQHAEPGTVLRSRDVELAFLGLIPQPVTAIQLLYRTMDMNGQPEATVTTVIVPAELDSGAALPAAVVPVRHRRHVVALFSVVCAAAQGEGPRVGVPVRALAGRRRLRRRLGGLGTRPRGPARHVGRAVRTRLPGPRRHPGRLELRTRRTCPPMPRSGCGDTPAVGWPARGPPKCAATYAPELDIVGAVLGSPVGDLGHTFRRLNGGLFAGLPALVVAALSHIYPDLDRVIKEHTNEEGRALLEQLETMTTVEAVIRMARKNMGDYLDEPLEDILATPEVTHVFDSIKLGAAVPTPPVLIVQAVHDYLIDVNDIDALADAYSAGGARVTYHRDAFNEHMVLHPLSAPMALRWLTDRFARRPLTEHLIRTTWPTMFNPMTYAGMARLAKIAAKVITGRKVHRRPL